jgi:uncharacterized membrane protein
MEGIPLEERSSFVFHMEWRMTQVIVGTFVAIFLGAFFVWILPDEIIKGKIRRDVERKMIPDEEKEREILEKHQKIDDVVHNIAQWVIGIVLCFMFAPIFFPLMFR